MTNGIEIKLESHLKEVMDKMADVAHARMTEAVNEVRNVTLKTLSGRRSGRTYYVPGTKRTYTASSPGEPPAQRLGELRQSVSTLVEGTGAELTGKVGTDKKYGAALEFGHMQSVGAGVRGGRGKVSPFSMGLRQIAARPWLRISFERSEAKVKAIFSRSWF